MLIFKKEKKKDVLKGRTIKFLTSSNILECSCVHLCNVLNGKNHCSKYLARDILKLVGTEAKIEDYFMEK